MTRAAQKLHTLTKKRKELLTLTRNKQSTLDHSISQNVSTLREEERKKRIEAYGKVEEQRQKLTSALMLELMNICEQDKVPRYVVAIAKILDNYQGISFLFFFFFFSLISIYLFSGGINTIRSNTNWLSEILTQLTDQMRNFDAAQTKLNAKCDLILEKVWLIYQLVFYCFLFYYCKTNIFDGFLES